MAETETLAAGTGRAWWRGRAEIDTSAPFESVKEAVDHYGGSGHWKTHQKGHSSPAGSENSMEEASIGYVEEQTAQLEQDLIVKERETLEVLKELEMTKRVLDGLKLKLQKETSEPVAPSSKISDSTKVHPITDTEEHESSNQDALGSATNAKPPSPSSILMQLKQAKLNLNRTTSDLAGIRASIDLLNSELEKENIAMEKTRHRIASNSDQISHFEKELSQTRLMLQLIKDAGTNGSGNAPDASRKLHELRSEAEQFKRMAETTEFEVKKLTEDIEQTKVAIKTAVVRLNAAKKMEEAARATEASARAELKAVMDSENSAAGLENCSGVTLSVQEYNMLIQKAQEAEERSRLRIETAENQVDEANKSKMELLRKVEEAKAEVKTSRKALGEALSRVEAANRGKLAVEEALRKWRSENGQRRRSVHSSPRFKNSFPGHHRRDSNAREMNLLNLAAEAPKSVLKPTLSIGQILSRKLLGPDECEAGSPGSISGRQKVSLGQMLSRRHRVSSPESSGEGVAQRKQFQSKRKFGLVGFSIALAKHNKKKSKKKKKMPAWSPK